VFDSFKAGLEKTKVDSFIIVVGTHGSSTKKNHLVMCDSKEVDLDLLINEFSNTKFPIFENKPKVFIVQACRSQKTFDPLKKEWVDKELSIDSNHPATVKLPDVYVSHSTVPFAYAYRNPVTGSPFINCLITTFRQHAHDHDIHGLQTKVRNLIILSSVE